MSKCFLGNATVWRCPLANSETAHCSRRFRVPAQMRSRCVGRGAARILPREMSRRRSKAARSAAADLRALWRRGDSFRLLRRHLPQRGRQGNRIYSLSHGVGFQPNAVTAPSRRRLQYAILQSKKAPAHPQEGAYNMEFYQVRKRFLTPSRRRREKTFVRYARRRVDRFHAPECLRAFPPSRR